MSRFKHAGMTRRQLLSVGLFAPAVLRSRAALGATTIEAAAMGAVGDGRADDTAALNGAARALGLGGGTLRLGRGRYRLTAPLLLGSGTTLEGDQAEIFSGNAWQLPAVDGTVRPRFVLVGNRNFGADSAAAADADHDIALRGISFAFRGLLRGDAHAASFRSAVRIRVEDCRFEGGGNGTAMIGCRHTTVLRCEARDTVNCAFDHWEGTSDGLVENCQAMCRTGYGILFTGQGTDRTNHRAAARLVARNNTIANPKGVGIWVCSLSEHSSVSDVVLEGNTLDGTGEDGGPGMTAGIGATGAIHNVRIVGNTVKAVNGNPYFIRPDKWHRPDTVTIERNMAVGCVVENKHIALIQALGDSVTVTGNRATGGSYRSLVWVDGERVRLADNSGDGLTSRFKYNAAAARAPVIADP